MYTQKNLLKRLSSLSDSIAIKENGQEIFYSELSTRSTKVAAFLLDNEFVPESRIGINVSNITDLVVCIIGIIQARCVFVPLDSSLPEKRFSKIIKESELSLIIVSDKDQKSTYIPSVSLSAVEARVQESLIRFPDYDDNDALYIYFTSGSTGTPKGIIGRNGGLWNFINWELETFEIYPKQKFSQLISPYFDAFLRDIFVPLMSGGTICIPPNKEGFFTSENMIKWIDDEEINFIHCVPSMFRAFNNKSTTKENFQNLKYVLLSGERIVPSELEHWYATFKDRIQLVNLYGATEATMISSYYNIKPEDISKRSIPIGNPIPNTKLLVLDKDYQACRPPIVGEVYIASPFLSKGYLNNAELTAEKFIKLDRTTGNPGMVFKTGDNARVLTDGTIELLGRQDSLIKLRGIRIELNEIQNTLLKNDLIDQAIVLYDKKLKAIAAFVSSQKSDYDSEELQKELEIYLEDHLPSYMIPSKIMCIDSFPLLSNGKVNRQALLDFEKKDLLVGPSSVIEENILFIWQSILDQNEISTNVKFSHLGGNSLNMMRLIPRFFSAFGVRVKLGEVFENFTIQKQGLLIEKKIKALQKPSKDGINSMVESNSINNVESKLYYPLSSSQKRLYFLYKFDNESLAYNTPQVVRLKGEIDRDRIEGAFKDLIKRHEGLRTLFLTIDEEPVQKIQNEAAFSIEYSESTEANSESVITKFIRPFDLGEAPLLRVGLVKLKNKSHLLLVDMHHIIADGVSQEILIKDFMALYNKIKLPKLRLRYTDYSTWQQGDKYKEDLNIQKEFWIQEFSDKIMPLNLPMDSIRPRTKGYKGGIKSFLINKHDTDKLREISEEAETTMFMTVLSIFNILLSKLSNRFDIVVGTNVAGRYEPGLENILGMFVNVIALRNHPKGSYSFKEFLTTVRTKTLSAFENQSYPFENLIEELDLPRHTNRNPLFDVMFSFQNYGYEVFKLPGLELKPFYNPIRISKFDMELIAMESGDRLHFNLEYSTELFRPDSIDRFIGYFHRIVEEVISD
ncbi:amino acid adenylation domain-containing protein, partial [Maribacter sp. 2307UL18-2]|uniref:amino acid adenylation domain-containing protein n=1 Tax=Maribacter sp. 2307UL18-2 TaxID=3386274 RepID=UPI0039BD1F98